MENEKNINSPSQEEKNIFEEYDSDTTPKEDSEKESITIPVKFNKEQKELTVDEASCLAQKGMKFEIISGDYDRIKTIAQKNGKSVSEFLSTLEEREKTDRKQELISQCGGNEEMAEHILKLEDKSVLADFSGFEELRGFFPNIKSAEDLPEQVVTASEIKGTKLLDEYLRHILLEEKNTEQLLNKAKKVSLASVGSQKQNAELSNPVSREFLKGLWG